MSVQEVEQVGVQSMEAVYARWKDAPCCVDRVNNEQVSWLVMISDTTAGCKHCMDRTLVSHLDLRAARGNLAWAEGTWEAKKTPPHARTFTTHQSSLMHTRALWRKQGGSLTVLFQAQAVQSADVSVASAYPGPESPVAEIMRADDGATPDGQAGAAVASSEQVGCPQLCVSEKKRVL